MKYLTFLDYSTFEATRKIMEAKLEEKDKEIDILKKHDQMKDEALSIMSDQLMAIMNKIKILEAK